jgi:hypothetical protein
MGQDYNVIFQTQEGVQLNFLIIIRNLDFVKSAYVTQSKTPDNKTWICSLRMPVGLIQSKTQKRQNNLTN